MFKHYKIGLISLLLLSSTSLAPSQASTARRSWWQIFSSNHEIEKKEQQDRVEKILALKQTPQRKALVYQTFWELVQVLPKEVIEIVLSYEPCVVVHEAPVRSLTFSPQTSLLAVGLATGDIALWNTSTALCYSRGKISAHASSVEALTLHPVPHTPQKTLLISGSTVYGHPVSSIRVQGNELAVVTGRQGSSLEKVDETVIVWDLSSKQAVQKFEPHPTKTAANEDAREQQLRRAYKRFQRTIANPNHVVVGSLERRFDLETKKHVGDYPKHQEHPFDLTEENAQYLKLSSEFFAKSAQDGMIVLRHEPTQSEYRLQGHTQSIDRLYLRGNYLVSTSNDCTVRVWDILQEHCIVIIEHAAPVHALHVSDNGYIVSGDDAGVVVITPVVEYF